MSHTGGYTSDGIGFQKQDTSYKAATQNKNNKLTLRQEVLQYFKNNPTLCVSSGTVALALYKDACQIQPRLTELANQGLIKDSGVRGQTKYGRSCILWRYSGKTEEEETKQDIYIKLAKLVNANQNTL